MYFATFEDYSESNAASFFSYHAGCMVYMKISTKFLKAKLFFHILRIFVTSLLPPLNKNKFSHPVKLLSFLCSCWNTTFFSAPSFT